MNPKSGVRVRPRQVIFIQDFEFIPSYIELVTETSVEFRLAHDVPSHAEHLLQGSSATASLKFLSPLLQKGEQESYQFVPTVSGEIFVACTIFTDMKCKIIVTPSKFESEVSPQSPSRNILNRNSLSFNSKLNPPVRDTLCKFIEAGNDLGSIDKSNTIIGIGRVLYDKRFGSLSESQSSSGISDSDDEGKNIDLTGYMDEKSTEMVHAHSDGHLPLESMSSNGNYPKIFVEDFSFRPTSITIHCNSHIEFIAIGNATQKLCCDDEFKNISIGPDNRCYVHQFSSIGEFKLINLIFSFMSCKISVVPLGYECSDITIEKEDESSSVLLSEVQSDKENRNKNSSFNSENHVKSTKEQSNKLTNNTFDDWMESILNDSNTKSHSNSEAHSTINIPQLGLSGGKQISNTLLSKILKPGPLPLYGSLGNLNKIKEPIVSSPKQSKEPLLGDSKVILSDSNKLDDNSRENSSVVADIDLNKPSEKTLSISQKKRLKEKLRKQRLKESNKNSTACATVENKYDINLIDLKEENEETENIIESLIDSTSNFFNPTTDNSLSKDLDPEDPIYSSTIEMNGHKSNFNYGESTVSNNDSIHLSENSNIVLPEWNSRSHKYKSFINNSFRAIDSNEEINQQPIIHCNNAYDPGLGLESYNASCDKKTEKKKKKDKKKKIPRQISSNLDSLANNQSSQSQSLPSTNSNLGDFDEEEIRLAILESEKMALNPINNNNFNNTDNNGVIDTECESNDCIQPKQSEPSIINVMVPISSNEINISQGNKLLSDSDVDRSVVKNGNESDSKYEASSFDISLQLAPDYNSNIHIDKPKFSFSLEGFKSDIQEKFDYFMSDIGVIPSTNHITEKIADNLSELKFRTQKQTEELTTKTEEIIMELRAQSSKEVEEINLKAERDSSLIQEKADNMANQILLEAKQNANAILLKAREENEHLKFKTQEQVLNIRQQADKLVEELRGKVQQEVTEMIFNAEKEIKEYINNLNKNSSDKKTPKDIKKTDIISSTSHDRQSKKTQKNDQKKKFTEPIIKSVKKSPDVLYPIQDIKQQDSKILSKDIILPPEDLDSNNLISNSSGNKKLNDSVAETVEIVSVIKGKIKSRNKEPNPKPDTNELDSNLKSDDTKEKFSYFMDSIEALLAKRWDLLMQNCKSNSNDSLPKGRSTPIYILTCSDKVIKRNKKK